MRISDWSSDVCSSDLVDGRAFGSSDSRDISGSNILDLEAGDYRIVVDADGDATGPYSFRLLDIANAAAISVDTPVDGHNEGRKTDIYAFDVTAGERFFFDRLSLSGGDVSWRLMGPDGEYVRGPELFDESGVFTLDRTGTYRVAIEGRDSNSTDFDYRFLLSRVSDGEAALTVGEAVTGPLAGPGASVASAFRSEEHTSELQSLMRISSAVFCLNIQNMLNSLILTLA